VGDLLAGFVRYPQLLRNVRVARKPPLDSLPAVQVARRRVEDRLGDDGRVVLRYSGTESLARIMIEGPDRKTIEGLADEIEEALRQSLA
jgi:phosphoglucosamine mutase